jgi:hypothetical protein
MLLQGEKMFVLSSMAYTMELAEHELTPAYHEIYKTSIDIDREPSEEDAASGRLVLVDVRVAAWLGGGGQ